MDTGQVEEELTLEERLLRASGGRLVSGDGEPAPLRRGILTTISEATGNGHNPAKGCPGEDAEVLSALSELFWASDKGRWEGLAELAAHAVRSDPDDRTYWLQRVLVRCMYDVMPVLLERYGRSSMSETAHRRAMAAFKSRSLSEALVEMSVLESRIVGSTASVAQVAAALIRAWDELKDRPSFPIVGASWTALFIRRIGYLIQGLMPPVGVALLGAVRGAYEDIEKEKVFPVPR